MLSKPQTLDVHNVANERLGRSFVDIAIEISHLNKVSNTIRRAGKESQNLEASDFQMKDDEGNDVEKFLLGQFERHIGDRFPNISKTIQYRLARAMLLRRKRILHRRRCQGYPAIQPQKAFATLSGAQPTILAAQDNLKQDKGQMDVVAATTLSPSQIKSATTLNPEKFKIAISSPSIISESKTVALGNHEALVFPPGPGLATKRRYEQLKRQRFAIFQNVVGPERVKSDAESKLKEQLESDLQAMGEVICPYCLDALPAQEVFDERKWQ